MRAATTTRRRLGTALAAAGLTTMLAIGVVTFLGTGAPGGLPAPGPAGGKFEVTCGYSHSAQVDPIVAPGNPMSAHLHDFFGNRTTGHSSTAQGLIGDPTTCKLTLDSAAYWVPAAYRGDTGARVLPVKVFAYYFGTPQVTEARFPAGLKMLSGNPYALTPAEAQNLSFSCGNGGNTVSPTRSAPYNCLTTSGVQNSDGVVATIKFPVCWNSQGVEPGDVTMPGSDGRCAGARFTQLQIRVHYGAGNKSSDFQRGDLLRFASGPWYTLHADFMNGWHQPKLDSLTDRCINAPNRDCGFITNAHPGP